MQKPTSIAYRQFINDFQTLINKSGLPAFILVPVIKSGLAELQRIEEQEYKRDEALWNKARQEKDVNNDGD